MLKEQQIKLVGYYKHNIRIISKSKKIGEVLREFLKIKDLYSFARVYKIVPGGKYISKKPRE